MSRCTIKKSRGGGRGVEAVVTTDDTRNVFSRKKDREEGTQVENV